MKEGLRPRCPVKQSYLAKPAALTFSRRAASKHNQALMTLERASQKNTNERTTTFFLHGASAGAVGSIHAEWNDQRDTDPSVAES